MTSSPPIENLQGLTLNESYEYDNGRPTYHYATSTGIPAHQFPGQTSSPAPSNQTQSPLKNKPARQGLPSQWLEQDGRSISPQNTSDFSSAGGSPPPMSQPGAPVNPDDDIIPTAIVIKNIPFNVKRETLLDIISSLSIPTPYAFNYHLDQQGAFRGLAFANFRQAVDADAVVAALNGFDVQGRKLRVEYKKVLQAGEKERIEREKAIRRMRSMQLEKEGVASNIYEPYGSPVAPPPGFPPQPQRSFSTSSYTQEQAAYSPPSAQIQSPVSYSHALTSVPPPQAPATPSASEKNLAPELDLNDPATLEIYSRILLFKDDRMRDELAFSRNLSPKQRRIVHLIAQKLGVFHYSMGEGEERYAVVTRIDPNRQQQRIPHTLSRAPSAYNMAQSPTATSPTSALRSKKSMPDMGALRQQAPRLTPRASNGNIREYATVHAPPPRRMSSGFASLFSQSSGFGSPSSAIPPVPGISSSPGNVGPLNGGLDSASVVRQPRGPGTTGFTRRDSRVGLSESAAQSRSGLEARTYEPLEI